MKLDGIKLNIYDDETELLVRARKMSGLEGKFFKILKKSLDARDKNRIFYVYSVEISDTPFAEESEEIKTYAPPSSPIVVGFGPAGMFCALSLARAGFKPIVLERGGNVDERKKATDTFFNSAVLDTECNIQYGEGGAGTFSDGKLNTGIKSEYKAFIMHEFIRHGAPKEIAYLNKPHIGSDNLPKVVKSIREEIISLGGKVLFNTALVDIDIKNGKITKLTVREKNGKSYKIDCDEVVLAIGHSSRDTYEKLFSRGVVMEQKDCAIGFRVEHLQDDINKAQFGKDIGIVADYKAVSNKRDRGVFSFCMCPGGVVVPASSEESGVVTNGMSEFKRDKINANSAIVCQIRKSDFSADVFSGMEYLRKIERLAFEKGGREYRAPCQNVVDFMKNKQSKAFEKVKPTYAIGTTFVKADEILPSYVCDSIRIGIEDIDKRIKGFAKSGVITMPETRTSSPVRIVRNENCSAVGICNLYPCGEVGFAGGITSSAVDGLKIANVIKKKYEK